MLKIFYLTCCLLAVNVGFAQQTRIIRSVELTDIKEFLDVQNVFEMTVDDFEKNWLSKLGGEWTDSSKKSARTPYKLKYYTLESVETIFNFQAGKFNNIKMMVFNQGDQGAMTEANFNTLVTGSITKVSDLVGSKPTFKPSSGASARNINFWLKEPYLYRLEHSSSLAKADPSNKFSKAEFRAEYLRLIISKFNKEVTAVNIDKVGDTILNSVQIREMVKKDDKGNVIIQGLPMIDQGQKGYCACATTARILNFYGRDADMHDIAKLSGTSDQGSNPEELRKAIERITSAMRLNMTTVVKCYLTDNKEIQRLFDKIEREYKEKGLKFNPDFVKKDEIQPAFDVMAKKDPRYKEFQKGIQTYIDRGQPISWALFLGIIPEPDIPQASGGHMRIILGYNMKEEKIYYSDSWGKGHEKKEMRMVDAFYVSMAVWAISPR